jgi:hypothetical protein
MHVLSVRVMLLRLDCSVAASDVHWYANMYWYVGWLQVTCARRRLESISPATIAALRIKRAVALLLTTQSDVLHLMLQEGLVTMKDAESVMADLSKDASTVQQRQMEKIDERAASFKQRRQEPHKAAAAQAQGVV